MAFAATVSEKLHRRRAAHVAGDDGQLGKRVAQHPHRIAHPAAVPVRGRNRHHVQAALHQRPDVGQDALAIQLPERVACRRNRRAAEQAEVRVACRLELCVPLLRDALDIAHGEQPVQPILVVHHQQLVCAGVVREELIRPGNGVAAQLLLVERVNLAARRERLPDLPFGVTRLHHVPREQAQQLALAVHDRKRAEGKALLRNQRQHLPDQLLRRRFDGLLDQAVDVVLHPADLRKLLPLGHVVMDQAQPAIERHARWPCATRSRCPCPRRSPGC